MANSSVRMTTTNAAADRGIQEIAQKQESRIQLMACIFRECRDYSLLLGATLVAR